MRIRPIARGDLDELQALARETGVGFTSLPDNRDFLAAKIDSAIAAFEERQPANRRNYFFVLEEEASGRLAGCCAIEGEVGHEVPFYHYRVGTLAHSSAQLDLHRTIDTLFLCSDHTGDAEVASLFLRPEYRGGDRRQQRNGALLSMMRWLFMAEFRDRFPDKVLAEMRGVFNERGRSPFWDCLGANFFPMDFDEADRLTGLGQKSFIGELMPKYPIYTPFLSEAARRCPCSSSRGCAGRAISTSSTAAPPWRPTSMTCAPCVAPAAVASRWPPGGMRRPSARAGLPPPPAWRTSAPPGWGAAPTRKGGYVSRPRRRRAWRWPPVTSCASWTPRSKVMKARRELLIGSAWQAGEGERLTRHDPVSHERLWEGRGASPGQVATAVEAARDAFPRWAAAPLADRQALVERFREVLECHREDLATAIAHETGKPLRSEER